MRSGCLSIRRRRVVGLVIVVPVFRSFRDQGRQKQDFNLLFSGFIGLSVIDRFQ